MPKGITATRKQEFIISVSFAAEKTGENSLCKLFNIENGIHVCLRVKYLTFHGLCWFFVFSEMKCKGHIFGYVSAVVLCSVRHGRIA